MRKDLGKSNTVNDMNILIVGLNFEPDNAPCISDGKQRAKC